jgi:hypothetical protein
MSLFPEPKNLLRAAQLRERSASARLESARHHPLKVGLLLTQFLARLCRYSRS